MDKMVGTGTIPAKSGNVISTIIQVVLEKNITKVGVIGASGYFVCQVVIAIHDNCFDCLFNSLGYLFLMLVPAGLAFRVKKGLDLIVASEAEKRIQNPNLTPMSQVPAIQREIEKQVGGKLDNGGGLP